jgi:glycosyltransferase involved in cell wall biosynthesis
MKEFSFVALEKSDLTIITLTYNSSEYIRRCINSIMLASACISEIEISHLVVDGFSKDSTIEIIKEVSPSSLILCREPAGVYEALNYAVSLVQSPYLIYVHSDDEIDEFFLVKMFEIILKLSHNQNYVLYGTVDFINENSDILFSRKPPFFIPALQKEVSIIFHPNAIYSTALEKTYPYNLNSGLVADKEHISEIASKTKFIRVPDAKYRFRMSLASSTMRKLNASKNNRSFALSLPKIYILLFETNLIRRLIMKLSGKSYWGNK